MNYFEAYKQKFLRQRRTIVILAVTLAAMTAAYIAQLTVTVETERERAAIESRCDELRNSLGMVNYEIGILEEERCR